MSNKIFYYGEDGKRIRIDLDNIIFLKVIAKKVQFWEQTYIHTVPVTLDEILSCLPKGRFVKIHARYAVAVDCILKIEYDRVVLCSFPCFQLPYSKKYLVQLMEGIEIMRKGGVILSTNLIFIRYRASVSLTM